MSVGQPVMQGALVGSAGPAGAVVTQTGFEALDRNHDGMISRQEFNQAVLPTTYGQPVQPVTYVQG